MQRLSCHLKAIKIYFSGYSGDLQGPWSSKAISPTSSWFLYMYVCIISARSQSHLQIILYLQPLTNTYVKFPSERQTLSLQALCVLAKE